MSSLLGTDAPGVADAVVVFEVAAGAALLLGAFFAHTGRIRYHAYLQSAVVFVNLPVVLAWMVPMYLTYVLPDLASEYTQSFYYVPTIMLLLGGAAEALGVYTVLVAGTNWLPERLRFRNYKVWMRSVVGLWWATLALGLLTYYVWYVSPLGGS